MESVSGAQENVVITVQDGHLYVDVDLQREGGLSKPGRSRIVASTHGWVNLPVSSGEDTFAMSMNVIRYSRSQNRRQG